MKERFDGMEPLYGEGPEGHLDPGYKVPEQKNEKNSTKENADSAPTDPSKRKFLAGMGSAALNAAVVGGTGYLVKEEYEERTKIHPTNSEYFEARLYELEDKYEGEIDGIRQYAFAPLSELDQELLAEKDLDSTQSVIEYAWNHIDVQHLPHSVSENERKWIVMGLLTTESRFDYTRSSNIDPPACGIAQIMPGTRKDLNISEAHKFSVVEGIRGIGEYFGNVNRFLNNDGECEQCAEKLEHIKDEMFDGNQAEYERHFLMPFLINSYNTGMGNMQKVLNWFVETYGTEAERNNTYELTQNDRLSGSDIFLLLADGAYLEEPVDAYKHEAASYTTEVYAAARVLQRHFGTKEEGEENKG